MKKFLVLASGLLLAWCAAMAVPAKPGFVTYTQSDGTQITVQLMGDEFFHYFVTQDGLPVDRDDRGDFRYVTQNGMSQVMAHNQSGRTAAELSFIAQQTTRMQAIETPQHKARRAAARAPRKVGQTQVPTMGSPRVPILLVQYTDKLMSNTVEQFEAHYKTGAKSVLQYFTDQSNGKYTPQYDIYGIYDLPSSRSTYGANDSQGNDKGVALMVCDAIDKAGDDIDWSQYDNDGDGEADVCIVVYAGPGEAQGASRSTIWPCQWDLASGQEWNDGTGPRNRNGVVINRFAVFNETVGSSDSGTTMDGIGTFCHEFSHCLGLPDFYCTTYASGRPGMGGWSLMNSGCYNGGAISGDTPIGYSAYEKNFMDWIDYVEPVPNTYYTLPVFNAKSLESDQAIKVVSDLNENEYFILENRRKQGWDQYIADEGVLITHFTYVPSRWEANTVNNEVLQLATIIPADNTSSDYSENADLYGETKHEFTPNSTPAMRLNMQANGSLASSTGGAGTLDKPVTEIVLNSDGSASLWYIKADLHVSPDELALRAPKGKSRTATFEVTGKGLSQDLELTLNDPAGVFSLDKAAITPAEVMEGALVTVTFAPQEMGNYSGTITLACEGVEPLTVALTGEGLIESETPVMQPADSAHVTQTSFRADWTDESPVENVKSYTLYVDYVKPIVGPQLLEDADFSSLTEQTETYWWWTTLRNVAEEASNFLPQGWGCGSTLYVTDGAIIAGSNLTTRSYELPEGYDKISVVVNAQSYNSSQYGASTMQLLTASGKTSDQVTTTDAMSEYTLMVDASSTESLTFTVTNYPQISSIKVYAGDVNVQADAPLLAVVETGDELTRVIEGITDTHYVVDSLLAGGTFTYKVEAIYVNDTRSDMSNVETVVLLAPPALRGDVNGDGSVDISDVNILIDIMLGKDNADAYDGRAYVTDGDQTVDIADVNAVIDIMLGKR